MTFKHLVRSAAATAMAAVCAGFVAGCSTPADYFHTLRPLAPNTSTGPGTALRQAHAGMSMLAVGPVTVPDELARNEWVIRVGDTGARVYDHQLWTQGLAADVAQSLVDYLDRGALGDLAWADAGPTGSGSGADLDVPAPLRLRVQVMRFDSMLAPGPAISDQVHWALECLPSDSTLSPADAGRYRSVRGAVRAVAVAAPPADTGVEEPQQRYDRLARGHSDVVRQVADDVAAAMRDSVAERARDCLAPTH